MHSDAFALLSSMIWPNCLDTVTTSVPLAINGALKTFGAKPRYCLDSWAARHPAQIQTRYLSSDPRSLGAVPDTIGGIPGVAPLSRREDLKTGRFPFWWYPRICLALVRIKGRCQYGRARS